MMVKIVFRCPKFKCWKNRFLLVLKARKDKRSQVSIHSVAFNTVLTRVNSKVHNTDPGPLQISDKLIPVLLRKQITIRLSQFLRNFCIIVFSSYVHSLARPRVLCFTGLAHPKTIQ